MGLMVKGGVWKKIEKKKKGGGDDSGVLLEMGICE